MPISIEQLLTDLRNIGKVYPKKNESYFRNNQKAAEELKIVCTKMPPGKYPEEIIQQKLLLELMEIFHPLKSSAQLSAQVRDTLVKYEPFKEFDTFLPGGAKNKNPTSKEMSTALKEMLNIFQLRYNVNTNITQASKVEMKI